MLVNMTGIIGYHVGEAVRVRVEIFPYTEMKKFSLDPAITSFEMLQNLLAKIFDIDGEFLITYLHRHRKGHPLYVTLCSDWDLDAAIQASSDPFLHLRVEKLPKEKGLEEWDIIAPIDVPSSNTNDLLTRSSFADAILTQVERTFRMLQKALHLNEDGETQPPKSPMTETEFRSYLDSDGRLVRPKELRLSVFRGGIEPSIRSIVWKHILNVYSDSFTTTEQLTYLASMNEEYERIRDTWRHKYQNGYLPEEIRKLTNNVWKDVLRTDRTHKYFSGRNNEHLTSLFNVLTTYALYHPTVSYCQGMSDIASPLLVTMKHEGHTYICFCSLMERLKSNFNHDGRSMMIKFNHLSLLLTYYDSDFYHYLKQQGATDLIFCYRWLLLELKREFNFDDALHMLEVLWSSFPPTQYREIPLKERTPESLMCNSADRNRHCSGYDTASDDSSSLELSFKDHHFDSNSISSDQVITERKDEDCRNYVSNCERENCFSCCASEGPVNHYSEDQSEFGREVSLCNTRSNDYHTCQPTSESSEGYLSREDSCSDTQDDYYCVEEKSAFLDSGMTDFAYRDQIILPDPHELGEGNPFVLFLSLAILLQHRDVILARKMDYNDMAMHFDKLVRKHNVQRVLYQARSMFADYLRLGWEDSLDDIKP